MALKDIANEDLEVNFDIQTAPPAVPPAVPPDPPSDLVYSGDQGLDAVKVVAVKSSSCDAPVGKDVCTTSITMTWTLATGGCPFSSTLYNFVSGGGAIVATSTSCLADSAKVLRLDDAGTCVGSWTLVAPPNTVQACACNVKIAAAGQSDAIGE